MDNTKFKGENVISGLAWSYAERMLAQGVSLIVTIILARKIAPAEFGAIAIITVFINLANTFATEGLGNALVQKEDVDEIDYSSMFYFGLGISLILYVVNFVFAKPLADFYSIPILIPALRVMGIRIILASVNSVQQAYISRHMKFKKFFFSTLIGTVVSAVVGIALAFAGFGIWALIFQYLVNACLDTFILSFTSGLKIAFLYSHKRVLGLVKFGWKLVVSALLISLYSNIRDLIVGKKYNSTSLAYYNKGNQFPSYIAANINTSISKVLFPAMAANQSEVYMVKRMARRSISVGTFLLMPTLAGFAMVSTEFVNIILTSKWLPSVPYLCIYCAIFVLQPLQTASLQSMKALGRSDIYLKLEIIKKIIGIIILGASILCFDKMIWIAYGALLAEIVSTVANIPINTKLIHYTLSEQIKDVFSTLVMTVMMCTVIYLIPLSQVNNDLVKMMVKMLVGGGVYLLLAQIFQVESFNYIKTLAMNIAKKGQK